MVEETDGEIEVTNQIDRVVEKTMDKKYGIKKKFSKEIKFFKDESHAKIKKAKKQLVSHKCT